MKTHLIAALTLVILFTFGACREITVTTKLNKDGSFTRIITVSGDSADVFRGNLPYPVDDSWHSTYRKDTTGEVKHILTFTKNYPDAGVLNNEVLNDTGWYSRIPRKLEISRRFGFFYTYLTFKDSYKQVNPFTRAKDLGYLSAREVELLTGQALPVDGQDSLLFDQLEEKVTDHLLEVILDEVIAVMDSGRRLLGNPMLDAVDLRAFEDSVVKKIDEVDEEDLSQFIDSYAAWSGEEAFLEMKALQPPIFDDLNEKWKNLLEIALMDGYTQQVQMPGLIMATNSPKLLGNQVSWEVNGDRVLFSDYDMIAESRVINYWAFVLAGAVVLALIILLLIKAFRK